MSNMYFGSISIATALQTRVFIIGVVFSILLFSCNKKELLEVEYTNLKVEYPLSMDTETGVITLDEKPKRVVSLTLATDEMLYALYEPDAPFAVSYLATNTIFSNIADKLSRDTIVVRGDNEYILSLNPNLILLASYVNADLRNSMANAGASIYTIQGNASVKDIQDTLYDVATLVDKRERAMEIITSMNKTLEDIRIKTEAIKDKPHILLLSVNGFTAGLNTTFDEIATLAGAVNVAGLLNIRGHTDMPAELLLKSNIDIIVGSEYNMSGSDIVKFFEGHPIYQQLDAVKNKRILIIPQSMLGTTSQFIVNSVVYLNQNLHPN